jgi:DNA-binding PucR family transcriptional regulator
VLNATGQNKTHAARILGIHPTSLLRRLKKTHELV